MSLKGKLLAVAGKKAIEKLNALDGVNGLLNKAINKVERKTGKRSVEEYIKDTQKNYLIIKSRSFSVGTMVGVFNGKMPNTNDLLSRYKICDVSGNIKYMSEAKTTVTNREILNLYDSSEKKIGSVKEHLISMSFSPFEKDVKKCTVYLGEEKICILKKYKSFSDIEFETIEGDISIKHSDSKKITIKYHKRIVANLKAVSMELSDDYVDKYVMEFDNPLDEVVGVLLAIALDIIDVKK